MEKIAFSLAYLIPMIIASAGLICGAIIGKIAKEELKNGKKYFIFMQNILVVLLIILIMYQYRQIVHAIWISALALFLYLYYFRKIPQWIVYAAFGIAYSLSFGKAIFPFLTAVIFIYGFPTGSLELRHKRLLAICAIAFLAVAIGTGLI